ncbi:MAG: hypothetical protein AAFX87_09330 [Bacteroidota bacterium]
MGTVSRPTIPLRWVALITFCVLNAFSALGQDAIISFQLTPPYNQPLEEYKDQLNASITLPSQNDLSAFLGVSIFNDSRSIEIVSTPMGRKQLDLVPGGNMFSGSDFDDLIDLNRLSFRGVEPDQVIFDTGLPPGRYFFCLELYNERGEQISNTACTNIAVDIPPVAATLVFLPPYNVPFDNFQDQTTLTLTTRSAFSADLEMTITDVSGTISISKIAPITLEDGANILTGTDLDFYFSQGSFNTINGVTETQLFDAGLPQGNYFLTFKLLSEGVSVASASRQFVVPASAITLSARITPPFDNPLDELLGQTMLTVSSSTNLTDAYVTVEITGQRLNIVSDVNAVGSRIDLMSSVPEVLTAGDLINVNGTGVQFQGITQEDALNQGLPSGNYSVCFRLFDNGDRLLTEVASCFSLNVPPSTVSLTVQALPPYIRLVEDLYNMLRVSVSATRNVELAFSVRIQGDNGVAIVGKAMDRSLESFSLEKNMPQLLSGVDLLSLFEPGQLTITGTNRNDILFNGLPEGNYQICLTPVVVDGPQLENIREVCSNSFPVNLIEAPQLILPTCGETVDIQRGQIIPFNWLPAPGAPMDTEYTLKIVEMLIPGQNPYDALLTSTSPAFFEETVMGTNFLYGPAQPLLEPGRTYAYQVFVADEFERGNYTNDGLSQSCWFHVADVTTPDEEDEEDDGDGGIDIVPIDDNPFDDYFFPVTKVSGTLRYKFKEDDNRRGMSNVIARGNTVAPTNNPVQTNDNNTSTSSSGGVNLQNASLGQFKKLHNFSLSPVINQSDVSTTKSFPTSAGIHVKLIEGYVVFGKLYGQDVAGAFVTDPWGKPPKAIATTTTDQNGNFEFTFIQTDSLAFPLEISSNINSAIASGTFFKVYRLVVDNPYYCSPEMNIVVQPWEHIEVGNLVSYVKSYTLKVIAKSGSTGAFFNDQLGGVGVTIPEVVTKIKRTTSPMTWPQAEGQNLSGLSVSEVSTDANGEAIFNKLVRHNPSNSMDEYYITVATSEFIGEYNFQTKTENYPQTNPPWGPYTENASHVFNSEWEIEQYEQTITMLPKLPRVFGEVRAQQPPPELAQQPRRQQSSGANNGIGLYNSSFLNLMSSPLGQSGLNVSQYGDIYKEIPNWSEMVNTASLSDVTVRLWEFNNNWQTDGTEPVVKLHQQSDANGQFNFESLQLEINSEFAVEGPARVMTIEHPGYTKFVKSIPSAGFLKWGQQYEVDDILLEPDGFVYGYIEDDQGNPVKAEVFIGEFTSAMTIQSQEVQDILGIQGDLKEVFVIKAPSGGNVALSVVPDNPIYSSSDFEVTIDENNTKIPQNLGGFQVNLYKHRITLLVTEEKQPAGDPAQGNSFSYWYPPVKNALVRVTNLLDQGPETNTQSSQPSQGGLGVDQQGPPDLSKNVAFGEAIYGYTDENGVVTLSFSNNAQEFQIEVIPPADKDLVKEFITITSEPSGQPVYAGQVELAKAWSVSGMVTYGNDSTPLANARVYIDDDMEAFTDSSGYYNLKYIPQAFSEYTITAENKDNPLTLVADVKTIQMPFSGNLNFNLTEFTDFEIKELMGIPVTVKSITQNGSDYLLDGAFIDLPSNENFSAKEDETQLDFYQIPITSISKDGKQVAKAVNNTIALDEHKIDLINYTEFIARQVPNSGNQLIMMADLEGNGGLIGKVLLMNSSFHFNEQYMSFNEETSSTSSSGQNTQFNLTTNTQVSPVLDNLKRSYIDLFSNQSQFRLFDNQQNKNVFKTLTAGAYPLQAFGVSDQNNNDYEFKVQDFNAVAKKDGSYVYQDSLVLSTTLQIQNIPLSIPKELEVEVGDIIVTSEGFEQILGGTPLTFKLEDWLVTCPDWTLDPNSTGIQAPQGKIDFGLFTTEILNIKLLPNDLQLGGINLNKIKLGDLVPVELKQDVTTSFGIDQAAGADNKPHWVLSLIGQNGQPAAAVKGLPGMLSSDEITMQEVMLMSNSEQKMIIGNQNQALTFYNIIKVKPDKFTMLAGGLQLSATLDLEIPLLGESYGSFRYTKENGQLQSQFLGMDVDFTLPGSTMHVGNQLLGAQTIEQNKFEAIGYIKHEEQVKLFTRLVKNLDSTYIYVDPLHQTLPISDDGSNWMAEVTGGSKVIPGNWNKFVFEADLMGMKGVEDSKRRKTFTINGSINAENEGLDVKNISASFSGMKVTYDFENSRLTGSLDFQQSFASVDITGHADFLTDTDGWLFIAGGSFTTPGFGKLSAGLGIGNYGNMNTLIAGNSIEYLLLQEARNKQLPDIFQNGFSGFFFTGMKTIPQLTLPKTGFDFLFVSGSLEIVTGFDARLWMGFDDGATEFGIGVMAFSELTLTLDIAITCTSLYGYLGAELMVEGMYNTGSGNFSLDGCASISIAGAVEQCFPVSALVPIIPPVCEGCGSTCGSIGVKAFMHFDAGGDIDAGFSLGSCSGNNPLSQEIKDKFNCN